MWSFAVFAYFRIIFTLGRGQVFLSFCFDKRNQTLQPILIFKNFSFFFCPVRTSTQRERCNPGFGTSWFSLNSDGSRGDLIKINGGGYRMPSSPETLREKVVDEYGNIRSEEQGYMQGADVFNFVIREIPRDIKRLAEWSGEDLQGLDYYVFHQANNFINTYLAKKLRLDAERIPSTIAKFGNTSSVSVPLTIASELKGRMEGDRKLLLSAFGVGMTWGTAVVPFRDLRISDLVEV